MNRAGGLLELVARGKKDVFFTANPTTSFFHSVYVKSAPFVKEIYVLKPRNSPEWGRWVDFDLDHRGDFLKDTFLRITLPTWLPPQALAQNQTGLITYDISGTTFGYCNNIGFQMIEKIQMFQDQVLLHETYGEYLDWRLRQSYNMSKTSIVADQVGARPETSFAVGRSASNLSLRVPIPILGWQSLHDPGLPMIALRNDRYRLRVFIRNIEDVVVSSSGQIQANPWSKNLRIQMSRNGGIDTSQNSLPKSCMKTLAMSLEATYVYVPADVQVFLKAQTLRFPFMNIQFQQYTLEDNIMTAASLNPQSQYSFPLHIDCIGSINRFLLGFRTDANTMSGQRTNLLSPVDNTPFVQTLRLNIANLDRVQQFPIAVFRELTSYWKNMKMALNLVASQPQEVYTISFGGFDNGNPMGTINFTRATDPVLFLTLQAIQYDPRIISRKTYALLYAESWNSYQIANGRGKLMFDDS